MICEKCGSEVLEKPKKDPWCMYKFVDGKVVSKLFDPDQIPMGWYDSPKAAKLGGVLEQAEPKQRRKRRTKQEMEEAKILESQIVGADNVDSSRYNQ